MKDQDEYMFAYASWISKHGGFAKDMTMRDHFAGLAMQSLLEGAVMDAITLDADIDCDKAAKTAYTMADAMLKEREKK